MKALNILILDDELKITEQITRYLSKRNHNSFAANTPAEAFRLIEEHDIDILISDIMLPGMNGIEVLKKVKVAKPELEVIMISGHGDMDTVIEAMRNGAVDYLRKPFGPLDIQLAIERTEKYIQLNSELKDTQVRLQTLKNQHSLISRELEGKIEKEFIGTSRSIKGVLDLALKASKDKDISVMITGENGTGKEIIARIIHYSSERKEFPFYPVNSSAIPESLLESEFFGHVRGAFTGADSNKQGCFELARGGSLFLDEIADMPLTLQAKLLRALEEKKIKPVGGSKEVNTDIRIITATNRKILDLVNENKFRIDLYHRINTLNINIPPLRERTEDIEPLLIHFINYFTRKKKIPVPVIDRDLVRELKKYSFPGNVRELRNMVERALILSRDDYLTIADFIVNFETTPASDKLNLEELEIQTIISAMQKSNYKQSQAARLLGISKDALFRRIKKYDLTIKKEIE